VGAAAWAPFQAILADLGQSLRQPALSLAAYSPALLAALPTAQLPIPGAEDAWEEGDGSRSDGLAAALGRAAPTTRLPRSSGLPESSGLSRAVSIAGLAPQVHVLGSKTRPRRLQLLGSDGRAHVFLLKGRDDLRLDERLMQVGTWAGGPGALGVEVRGG
jgi:serine/threonine-protein kinase SMG1